MSPSGSKFEVFAFVSGATGVVLLLRSLPCMFKVTGSAAACVVVDVAVAAVAAGRREQSLPHEHALYGRNICMPRVTWPVVGARSI